MPRGRAFSLDILCSDILCSSAVPLVAGRAMETARLIDTGKSPCRHRQLFLSPRLSSQRFFRLLR